MLFEDPERSTRFKIWMKKATIRIGYTVIHEDWYSGVTLLVKNSEERARHVQCGQAIRPKGVSFHKGKGFRRDLELLPRERIDQTKIDPLFDVPIVSLDVLK
jgi:hypothetical protein